MINTYQGNNAEANKEMKMKKLMNMQGQVMTETEARDYYGERFDSAVLVAVFVDEDGEITEL